MFIKILDTDTEEVKKGKSDLNDAFDALDKKAQEALKPLVKRLEEGAGESELLKKSLGELQERFEKEGKSQADKIEELTKSLTELSRVRIEEQAQKIKTYTDGVLDALEGKEQDIRDFLAAGKKNALSMQLKVVGNQTIPTGGVNPQFAPIVGPAYEMAHLRNFIPVSQTNSNSIRYLQFTDKDGAIAPVVGAGTAKPQFDWTGVAVDAPVVKIAGYVNVVDEFLEDLDGARDFLSLELPEKLYEAEDNESFKGPGGTGRMAGLYTNATALVFPYAGVSDSSNNIDKLAAAATYVRRQKRKATAAWTSPEDYLAIWINKSTGDTQVYSYPIRFNDNNNMLMIGDLPVLEHTVFNPGEGMVGDFARGARFYQKKAPQIRFSTEHASNFTNNVTTVLIEERIALANFYPDSFVKVELNGASS